MLPNTQTIVIFKLITLVVNARQIPLRVMTFNTWNVGQEVENGFDKIVKHILAVSPDVVAIQEWKNYEDTPTLLKALGREWSACYNNNHVRCLTIVRKIYVHPLQNMNHTFPFHAGCRLIIDSGPNLVEVDVWNVHLWYDSYGPYAACSKRATSEQDLQRLECAGEDSALTATVWNYRIKKLLPPCMDRDKVGRMGEINALMAHGPFMQATIDHRNLILVGDFNSPSHLDWTPAAQLSHCGVTCEWPVSKKLADYGFIDSYRIIHPETNENPGNTWTPVYKYNSELLDVQIEEPQDRIDHIYYRGTHLIAVDSAVYHGGENIKFYPNHRSNDWPSDHSAVFTDFILEF